MLDRLAPLTHGVRIGVEPLLHSFQHLFVLPARDASLGPGGAMRLERAFRTRRCPVAPQLLSVLLVRVSVLKALAGRTAVDVLFGLVGEVLLAKSPRRLRARCHGLRQRY